MRSFFKAGRAEEMIYFGASEAGSEAIDETAKRSLKSLISIVFIQRFFKLGELLLGIPQLIKQLHLLQLPLQQLLLKPSKHAIQLKNPLLHHAFIAQGNYGFGDTKRGFCALHSAYNPIQHSFTPAVLGCGQKASTMAGVL